LLASDTSDHFHIVGEPVIHPSVVIFEPTVEVVSVGINVVLEVVLIHFESKLPEGFVADSDSERTQNHVEFVVVTTAVVQDCRLVAGVV
jgi:hypothetical protein